MGWMEDLWDSGLQGKFPVESAYYALQLKGHKWPNVYSLKMAMEKKVTLGHMDVDTNSQYSINKSVSMFDSTTIANEAIEHVTIRWAARRVEDCFPVEMSFVLVDLENVSVPVLKSLATTKPESIVIVFGKKTETKPIPLSLLTREGGFYKHFCPNETDRDLVDVQIIRFVSIISHVTLYTKWIIISRDHIFGTLAKIQDNVTVWDI